MLNKEKTKGFLAGAVSATLITGAIATVFAAPVEQAINVVYDNYRIIIDGADKSNAPDDSKPFVYNGRTFVPLRYIAESMGKKVLWDGDTSTIYINDEGNSREDIYFATHGYEKSDKNIYTDENTVGLFTYVSHSAYDTRENEKYIKKRSIVFNLNNLAKNVSGTVDMSDTEQNCIEGKVIFYDQNDNMIYQTPTIRNTTNPVSFDFSATGVLQLRAEFIVSTDDYGDANIKLKDFRYSK